MAQPIEAGNFGPHGRGRKMTCCVSGQNHSKDRVILYTGKSGNLVLCGYHYARYGVNPPA